MRAAVGFSIHTGWAALVVVSSTGEVVARARIDLAGEPRGERFVFHLAAEQGDAERRIREKAATARQSAERAVRAYDVQLAALAPAKKALPPLEAILKSHALIHAAEGDLYRRAVEEGCAAAGLTVVHPTPRALDPGKIGPPWAKDQRTAAALAWGALSPRASRRT